MALRSSIDSLRQPFESDEQWSLKREFIQCYTGKFPLDKLLCLAQIYTNVEFLSCSYPAPVMQHIHELTKNLHGKKELQENRKERVKSQFIPADQHLLRGQKRHTNSEEQSIPSKRNVISFANDILHQTSDYGPITEVMHSEESANNNSANLADSAILKVLRNVGMFVDSEMSKGKNVIQELLNAKKVAGVSDVTFDIQLDHAGKKRRQAFVCTLKINNVLICKESARKKRTAHFLAATHGAQKLMKSSLKIVHLNGDLILEADDTPLCRESSVAETSFPGGKKKKKLTISKKKYRNLKKLNENILTDEIQEHSVSKKICLMTAESDADKLMKSSLKMEHSGGDLILEAANCVSPLDNENSVSNTLVPATLETLPNSKKKFKKINKNNPGNEIQENSANSSLLPSVNEIQDHSANSSWLLSVGTDICIDPSLRERFFLMEYSKIRSLDYAGAVLRISAVFCNTKIVYKYKRVKQQISCWVFLEKKALGHAVGYKKTKVRVLAAKNALANLKSVVYTVRAKTDDYANVIQRKQFLTIKKEDALPESNIGHKMLKMMGWTGGGIGRKGNEGISDPVSVGQMYNRSQGLGYATEENTLHGNFGSNVERGQFAVDPSLFSSCIEALIGDYTKSNAFHDLVFSRAFAKSEKKEIQRIARENGLKPLKGDKAMKTKNYMAFRRNFTVSQFIQWLMEHGGSTEKFELIHPNPSSVK